MYTHFQTMRSLKLRRSRVGGNYNSFPNLKNLNEFNFGSYGNENFCGFESLKN